MEFNQYLLFPILIKLPFLRIVVISMAKWHE